MRTLLQSLFSTIQQGNIEPVAGDYIEMVLPALEEVDRTPLFNWSEMVHDHWGVQQADYLAPQQVICHSSLPKRCMLFYTLNSLLIAWNLIPLLGSVFLLSENEKRLLCLSSTLKSYSSECQNREGLLLISEHSEILEQYQILGEKLNFDAFWITWREYLTDIVYIIQNIQSGAESKALLEEQGGCKLPIHRLRLPLAHLLAFGTLAAQLTSPADVVTKTEGGRLQEHLQALGIDRTLVYHRLRSCTGLLTNSIHNSVLQFTAKLDWQPILFFAEGVIYLAPPSSELPDRIELQEFVWKQVNDRVATGMVTGEIGFKRDGKGLKVAPQTLEFLSAAQLIQNLPGIIVANIKNETNPATPKRLERLKLSPAERGFLAPGADLRSDRIAEFIVLLQKEFFGANPEFVAWVLDQLGIQSAITLEQTQIHTGGFCWGWYHAAAYYVASNPHLDLNGVTTKLQEIANQLAVWAEEKKLLPAQTHPTREVFDCYLAQYLELPRWKNPEPTFQHELATYVAAKTKAARQPICSLSSGEFASEDQMDSVVLFKPQQYSNKNLLGGRQIKRGISKIWSLEMLLRQAIWSVSAGKLEERQPVFLYLVPALVHAPQVTKTIRMLVNQLKPVNLWEVRRFWRDHGMDARALRFYPWLRDDPDPKEDEKQDLPFMAIVHTTTKGRTTTDAWVEPIFLAIALPLLLGVKVVATASSVPSYNSGDELQGIVKLDKPASFWNLLGLPTSISLEERTNEQRHYLNDLLNRLLIAYSVHLDCKSKPPDPRWQTFPGTVRELATNGLAIFSLARSHLQSSSDNEVQRYWDFARLWSTGNEVMEQQLELTQRLVQEYRTFYKVHVADSSYAIVLPLSKVLEDILSTPINVPVETLTVQILGRLHDTVRRQKPYHRPLIMDQSLSIEIRANNEFLAIQQFVTTCIKDLFLGQYKGDRALLQQYRNWIKSGAEAAYRLLAMQEPTPRTKKQQIEESPYECS